ncbi:response regulator transcription factor [Novipirellula artificiosorum]|uniref:Oxygen regulatory protein NreC n=1 Tax=Novipirellula artificiosorum TaxID=2528016 RepID=A0A5C6DGP1_9BACT|nr:response regulator transcription factor [Novipirellula artificiosorum]TWU35848.1 Oxygen regulatory protein NreC [Novipirellula artificiosorum]
MSTVMIVDDHPITREGLAMRIRLEPDLEVCGEAEDVEDALAVIEQQKPDAAVIDVSLKSGNGIELVKEIRTRFPDVRLLVWSMYDDSLYAERALHAGANGYLNKRHAHETMIDAIRTILAGEVFLSPEFSAKILKRLSQGGKAELRSPSHVLSDRELEVFVNIGKGMKTSEIAEGMRLSPNTIETYRSRIKDKLALSHTAELARVATHWVLENS